MSTDTMNYLKYKVEILTGIIEELGVTDKELNKAQEQARFNYRMSSISNTKYTVWVGGTEVNDSLLEYDDAMEIADSYKKKGHTDVIVECVEYNEGAL